MKKRNVTGQMSRIMLVMLLVVGVFACTHDNDVTGSIDPPDYSYPDDLITLDDWSFDKTHSSVRWESLYLGSSALLTGRFNSFIVESLNFKADDPSQISFTGMVNLKTVNTGEPGRDDGCLQGTFGTDVEEEARITSKSASFDEAGGYIVTCDLDFHGFTNEVTMRLNYTGTTRFDESSGLRNTPFSVAGLVGVFEFNAISDFGIESSNIADRVTVRCNLQFKKPG